MVVLDSIPFSFDFDDFLRKSHMSGDSEPAEQAKKFVERILDMVKPKAVLREEFLGERKDSRVEVGSAVFHSQALSDNLEGVGRVFPFVATCGSELDRIDLTSEDYLAAYWLDTLKAMALSSATTHLREVFQARFGGGKYVTMNPGSADRAVWPIEQQRELFSLFGNVEKLIGVVLTNSYLMIPNKSVSGIFFHTEVSFVNCQLCTREDCPNRKAPYEEKTARDSGK